MLQHMNSSLTRRALLWLGAAAVGLQSASPSTARSPQHSKNPKSPTHTLELRLSKGAWQGDALFTVSVDGVRIGGPSAVTASHATGQWQDFMCSGNWGDGSHQVTVSLINDACGDAPAKDRSLCVGGLVYDGQNYPNATASLFADGSITFTVGGKPIPAPSNKCHFGVNLCGTEFPSKSVPTTAELDYYRSKGIVTFRLPLRWEFLQPAPMGPLDRSYISLFKPLVDYAAKHGERILLDIHNFGRANTDPIGSGSVTIAAFVDLWRRLATVFNAHPGLEGYDIMNEPHDMPTMTTWPEAAQAAVTAIRKIDMVTPIYVEGDGWSNASDWLGGWHLNSQLSIHDPADKIIYSAHVYADWNKTGTYSKSFADDGATTETLIDRVNVFQGWLRQNGFRGHIGECGVPPDAGWLACLDAFLAYLSQQANIAQMHYWAAGNAWGRYPLSIEPIDGVDRPQMGVLSKYTKE
jgi:Cellulase (glycosyl hydrolase family 5)/Ca-dependent carbohydrate-binding module xylan-binding